MLLVLLLIKERNLQMKENNFKRQLSLLPLAAITISPAASA